MELNNIPEHVAIIMDGNGRWAKKRGLPRIAGHREGIKKIEDVIKIAKDLGVKVLTIYAFSTENWSRPKEEIDMLMHALGDFLKKRLKDFVENNIRINVIGRREPIPNYLWDEIQNAVQITKKNDSFTLNVAFNYGSRAEIVDAVYSLLKKIQQEDLRPEEINEKVFSEFLYTKDFSDPDLLIRTSGEQRVSNFLLWQISYAELYFTEVLWPDFGRDEFNKALLEYQTRKRRFGGI